MRPNSAKEKLKAGNVVVGSQIQQFRSTEPPRIFAAAGAEFLWIDMEHGSFDFETVQDIVRATADAGPTPIVRVGDLQYTLVARALDLGAQGVILPRLEAVEQLREAISWTRFPPDGRRGYGLSGPALRYQRASMSEVIEHANLHTLVIVQFETIAAIERQDELLALPGVDVAFVGPADLSVALGVPGQLDHPRFIETVTRLIDSCNRHGVAPGIHLRAAELATEWLERGMRFISVGNEHQFLLERAAEVFARLAGSRNVQ